MKHKRIWIGALAGLLVGAMAATATAVPNVTQGYKSDAPLQNGLIVRLDPKDATKVDALKRGQIADMLGVTVASTDAPLSISDPNSPQQVYVATYGKYLVLVSDENGVIKPGDYITISSLDGVGMRADGSAQIVLGKALLGFAGKNDAESQVSIKDSAGGSRNVSLRRIPVDITVAHNPNYTGDSIANVPAFLSNIARTVSNKPVTALRVYACLGVLLLALIVSGGVMYSGVRSGMNAVGRNPLAKKSITRNLVTVILMSLIVVVIGLVAVYLLLRV